LIIISSEHIAKNRGVKTMALQNLISHHAEFNLWANSLIVEWLKTINQDLITQSIPSSFPNIDSTLQHIGRTQKFWLAFISQQDLSRFVWSIDNSSLDAVYNEVIELSESMNQVFSNFSGDELEEYLELNMPWAQNKRPRYEYILHVVNHSTFHRGQIVAMARILGVESGIPATDYNIFNCR
jgi:uncharacterized damage-inducible protein DinB